MSEESQSQEANTAEQPTQEAQELGAIAIETETQGPTKDGEGLSWQDTADMVNSTLPTGQVQYTAEDIKGMDQRMAEREGRPVEERVLRREPLSENQKTANMVNLTLPKGQTPYSETDIAGMRDRMIARGQETSTQTPNANQLPESSNAQSNIENVLPQASGTPQNTPSIAEHYPISSQPGNIK